jgi:glycosyltransferase involved in cell wall biosynthesis
MDIAVIIPTYNRADLLPETLDSILAQTHSAAEVVVVDDGSTDDTESIVRVYGTRVRYVRIKNSGEAVARNAGVAASSAEWIAFCDSDDIWTPEKLELQAELCSRRSAVQQCFTNFRVVTDGVWSTDSKFDSSPPGYWEIPHEDVSEDLLVLNTDMIPSLMRHQPIFPSTQMMKRSVFESIGRWNEPLGRVRSGDLDFHLRFAARPPIGVVKSPVVGIRKHEGNFSGDAYVTLLGELQVLDYVLAHHSAARKHEAAILESIERRKMCAAVLAFEAGNFQKMRELLTAVPWQQQPWKLIVKGMIARFPERAAGLLHSLCVQRAESR